MDKNDCLNADWHAIGDKDGARGRLESEIGIHRQACAKYGIKPDLAAYRKGHLDGIRKFCSPSNGYKLGTQGDTYEGICPDDLESSFLEAYQQGKNIYILVVQLNNNELRIKQMKMELERINQAVYTREALLIRGGISDTDRNRLIEDLKELRSLRRGFENAISDREHNLEEFRQKIRRLKATSSYTGVSTE